MWLMFLHFPNVIKPAAVTGFTAVTAPMCHESVTEPLSRAMSQESVTVWPPSHTIWHRSHSLLGISHNISSPLASFSPHYNHPTSPGPVLSCSLSDSESRLSSPHSVSNTFWRTNYIFNIIQNQMKIYSVFEFDQVFLATLRGRGPVSLSDDDVISLWQVTTRL